MQLRCSQQSLQWLTEQMTGGLTKLIRDTLSVLTSEPQLKALGFLDKAVNVDGLCTDPPLAVDQNEQAELLGRLLLRIVFHHLRRWLWMLRGWPGRCCLLAHPDAEVQNTVRDELRRDYDVWQELKGQGKVDCRKVADRSCFTTMPVVQTAVNLGHAWCAYACD